jgi:hypothetical protein
MKTTIEQATQQIEAAQAALELAKCIPDLSQLGFPVEESYFGSSSDGLICINLPYSIECYRRFAACWARAGKLIVGGSLSTKPITTWYAVSAFTGSALPALTLC